MDVIMYNKTLLPATKFWHTRPWWSILFSVMLHQTERAIYSPVLQKRWKNHQSFITKEIQNTI